MEENREIATYNHSDTDYTITTKTYHSYKKQLCKTPLLLLLFLIVLPLSLVSCNGGNDAITEGNPNNIGTTNETNTTDTEESSDTDTESLGENQDTSTESKNPFEEIIVVDNENCKIKITDLDLNGEYGPMVKAYFENKSTDTNYIFEVEDASINGVKCDPYFLADVPASSNTGKEIIFDVGLLEKNGIVEFTDIELIFKVYNMDNWSEPPIFYERFHIYPFGEDKAITYIREPQESDIILLDNEYATVIITSFEKDTAQGKYIANLFIVNNMDKRACISVNDSSVNGYMSNAYIGEDVVSKSHSAFSYIYWNNAELEENGITDIEEISFLLEVSDYDVWSYAPFVSEVITVNP